MSRAAGRRNRIKPPALHLKTPANICINYAVQCNYRKHLVVRQSRLHSRFYRYTAGKAKYTGACEDTSSRRDPGGTSLLELHKQMHMFKMQNVEQQ